MKYGVQIASFVIVTAIIIVFFQQKRIKLMSTRFFTGFLWIAVISIFAEYTTLYTINHIETIDPVINRLCHQIFIGSLNILVVLLFLYVDMKSRQQKRYRVWQLGMILLPIIIALYMVVFGRLDYYIGDEGRYSYGPMAQTLYTVVAIYMLATIVVIYLKRKAFSTFEIRNLLLGIFIWGGVAVYQFINPESLLSSLGVGSMVAFVYISFENPREYQDHENTRFMNLYAFRLMVTELTERRAQYHIVNIVICNGELIRNMEGYSAIANYLEEIGEDIFPKNTEIFRIDDYLISALFTKQREYDKWLAKTEKEFPQYKKETEEQNLRIQINTMDCPGQVDTVDSLMELIDFCRHKAISGGKTGLVNIGDSIVSQKKYNDTVERMIQKAIKEDGLEVYYQPIYSMKDNAFTSAEALVRLKDRETLGFVSPEVFIPMAEKKGLIRELSNIVFEKVCAYAAENNLKEKGISYIEVNLSAIQSADKHLPKLLFGIMNKYGITPDFINLEITETASVKAGEQLSINMQKLKEAGCRFSMDDFGTGYSNLAQIAQVQFKLIKLDKTLIWPCFEEDGDNARVVLEACINMIHKLGISIVAEGVETKEQVELLEQQGVEYLQGYFYSRPLPQEDFTQFIESHLK